MERRETYSWRAGLYNLLRIKYVRKFLKASAIIACGLLLNLVLDEVVAYFILVCLAVVFGAKLMKMRIE